MRLKRAAYRSSVSASASTAGSASPISLKTTMRSSRMGAGL
jgi:hypothetical protein